MCSILYLKYVQNASFGPVLPNLPRGRTSAPPPPTIFFVALRMARRTQSQKYFCLAPLCLSNVYLLFTALSLYVTPSNENISALKLL